jgi:tetratricopeptide (TPR) repeat protein
MHRFAEAQAVARPVVERAGSADDLQAPIMGFAFMRSLDAEHELDEKEGRLREHFEVLRQEGLAGANWVGSNDYTQLLVRRGKIEEALRVSRDVHEYWRATTDTVESGLTKDRTDFIRDLVSRRYQSTLAAAERWGEVRALERERLVELRTRARAEGADASAWNGYAWELLTCESPDLRDPEEGLAWATRAVEAGDGANPVGLAGNMDTQAKALKLSGDLERAFDIESRALQLCEEAAEVHGDDGVVELLPELVRYATRLSRNADAEESLRGITDGIVSRHGPGSRGATEALRDVGDALASRGFHDWAVIPLQMSVDEARQLGDKENLLSSLTALARSRARGGALEEAEALVDEAIRLYRNIYVAEPIVWTAGMGRTVEGERSWESLYFKRSLAYRLLDLDRLAEAEELLHQVQCASSWSSSAYLKGRVLLARGDAESALPALRFALYRSRLSRDVETEPGGYAIREGEYGHCLSLAGRREEGETVLLRAYDRAMEWCGPASTHVADIARWTADLYEGWGKLAEAAEWRNHESLPARARPGSQLIDH